ncbi:hydroxyethylthiazole kinase [Seohaeicola zhoushanensis]|uniref:Hydroxyethylthiazole kinase n=1 Tax=Seohaeicola zhoushanensis TaxID=1569283 RepID=A0A8J3GY89_9RHOB|nr:hydroxyethylthiazole kinase [Seohaeicola zhoushanensis]GHF51737.1 hydroxyethylthiazole kinase [Seohaeicola zhoushanensis]
MTDWGTCLTTMRQGAPLVQNITNYVSMNVMANVMLAVGASPAMVHAEQEAAEFAAIAQALTINIGTLSAHWIASMKAAASIAAQQGKPWVLDPVAVGATAMRRQAGRDLLALKPTIIKGNASEIMALAGEAARGKGADSADSVADAEGAALALARASGAVVAVTGPVDFVTDGSRSFRIANGDATMPRITALGCSLGGVMAAFAATQPPLQAAVAALAYFGLAGEIAAETSQGPGSFAVAFLDALHSIDAGTLSAGAKVTEA